MRICPRLLFVLIFVLPTPVAFADIYRYVDAQGRIHFTDTPTNTRFVLYMKDSGVAPEFGEIIQRYSQKFRLESALVHAVIKAESDFNPRAISRKGAIGMMQLLPQTAKDLAVRDPFNAEENIRGGSRYLRMMLDQFDDNLELALAAYNAGPNAVRKHGGIPPYEETQSYVKKVKRYLKQYRQEGV